MAMMYKKASSMCLLLIAIFYSSKAAPPESLGCKKVPCYINPCHFASCPAIDSEGVTCVADHCGGCFARWFLNGQEVTDQCGVGLECSTPGQMYATCGPACIATCEVPNPICTKHCVSGCNCPSGTVFHESKCISRKECPK